MKLTAILAIFIVAATLVYSKKINKRLINDWNQFKHDFQKNYSSYGQELMRQRIWEENMVYIHKHNYEANKGKHTYLLEMNRYGDLRPKEFARIIKKMIPISLAETKTELVNDLTTSFPSSVDWRIKGCVLPVRDQGMFGGNLWAFGAAESLAGVSCVKSGKLVPLSEQQIIDCDKYDEGCEHQGTVENAFHYIKDNGGIDSSESYPYVGTCQKCQFKPEDVSAKLNDYQRVIEGNETDLAIALATYGPLSAGIDASKASFQFYKSGIYYEPSCSNNIDHLLLLVGYGTLGKNRDYYIAKNSWGVDWGKDGYINMSRNRNNNCGIASYVVYPII